MFGFALFHILPFEIAVVFGILPLAIALMGALRRLILPSFIELEQDAILVPSGFLQIQKTRIPFAGIEQAWEAVTPRISVFHLRAKGRMFEVNSMLLPDRASYVAIKNFVNARITSKDVTRTNPKPVEPGAYCFKCSYEGNGEISNSNSEVLWRIETPFNRPLSPLGLGPCPDFSIYDKMNKELFRVKHERHFWHKRFVVTENDLPVCTIRQKSILFNKYTLDFVNGQSWVFRMPLFTVTFTGQSKTGEKIRVRFWNHNTWLVLIDPNVENSQLVTALAFLHRERLRCI